MPDLKSDCANCAALCCVAPHFGQSDKFAFTKPEGVPCRHLAQDFRCTIHGELTSSGFAGCVEYDCFGAGQKTTQRFAPEGNWRGDDALAERIFAVYHVLRPLHELMVYLTELRTLTGEGAIRAAIDAKLAELDGLTEASESDVIKTDIAAHKDAVERLIARVRETR
jgi:hypothetical protein